MIPNPGSQKAQDQGCVCPVIDNHYGKGIVGIKDPNPKFWINGGCDIHSKEERQENQEG